MVPEQAGETNTQTMLNARLKDMSSLGYLWADKKGVEWWSFTEESRLADPDNTG